jgi:hypothetical protein
VSVGSEFVTIWYRLAVRFSGHEVLIGSIEVKGVRKRQAISPDRKKQRLGAGPNVL